MEVGTVDWDPLSQIDILPKLLDIHYGFELEEKIPSLGTCSTFIESTRRMEQNNARVT